MRIVLNFFFKTPAALLQCLQQLPSQAPTPKFYAPRCLSKPFKIKIIYFLGFRSPTKFWTLWPLRAREQDDSLSPRRPHPTPQP